MNWLKSCWHYILIAVTTLAVLLYILIAFLLSPAGFKTICSLAEKLTAHQLTITQPSGSLSKHINIKNIIWKKDTNKITIKNIYADIHIRSLLKAKINILNLEVASFKYNQLQASQSSKPLSQQLKDLPKQLHWPRWLILHIVKINHIKVVKQQEQQLILNQIILNPLNYQQQQAYTLNMNITYPQKGYIHTYILDKTDNDNIHVIGRLSEDHFDVHAIKDATQLNISDFKVSNQKGHIEGSLLYYFNHFPSFQTKAYFYHFLYHNRILNGYLTAKVITADNLDIHSNISTSNHLNYVKLNLTHKAQWIAQWNIQLKELHQLIHAMSGYVKSQGKLNKGHFSGTGNINIKHILVNNFDVSNIESNWSSLNNHSNVITVDSSIKNISYKQYNLHNINLMVRGNLYKQLIHLNFTSPWNQQVILKANGLYTSSNKTWVGDVHTFNMLTQFKQLWQLNNTFKLTVDKQITIADLYLKNKLNYFKLNGDYNPDGTWQLMSNSSLTLPHTWLPTNLVKHVQLSNQVTLKGNQQQLLQLNNQSLLKTRLYLNVKQTVQQQDFQISNLLQLNNQKLNNTMKIDYSSHNIANLSLTSDNFTFSKLKTIKQLPLNISLQGNFPKELYSNIINKLATSINMNSTLTINGKLSGTLATPTINLDFNQPGSFHSNTLNKSFQQTKLTIDQNNPIKITLSTHLDGQKLLINGRATHKNNIYHSVLTFKHHAFQIMDQTDKKITIQPDMTLNCSNAHCLLKGSLTIPSAQYTLTKSYSSVTLPMADMRFVHNNIDYDNWTPYMDNFNLLFGKKVTLSGYGLHGDLTGHIKLTKDKNTPLLLEGPLRLNNAYYTISDSRLNLTTANFSYLKSPVDNPHLSISAEKKVYIYAIPDSNQQSGNIIVGLTITGLLKHPVINLYSSSQALSQADILSYLFFNQPASSTSILDSSTLFALSSDGLNNGVNVINTVKNSLGLTEFGLEADTSFDQSGNVTSNQDQFVIGKKFGKKLYLRFSHGLSNANNIWMLIYQINQALSLQLSDSQGTQTVNKGTAIDLMYQGSR